MNTIKHNTSAFFVTGYYFSNENYSHLQLNSIMDQKQRNLKHKLKKLTFIPGTKKELK